MKSSPVSDDKYKIDKTIICDLALLDRCAASYSGRAIQIRPKGWTLKDAKKYGFVPDYWMVKLTRAGVKSFFDMAKEFVFCKSFSSNLRRNSFSHFEMNAKSLLMKFQMTSSQPTKRINDKILQPKLSQERTQTYLLYWCLRTMARWGVLAWNIEASGNAGRIARWFVRCGQCGENALRSLFLLN